MFYTYLWLRENGTPYYVGKGSGERAFVHWERGFLAPKDRPRILVQEFPTEADAFAAERFFIAYYGRKDLGTGCLRNHTEGGEGVSGYHYSEEQLRKRAEQGRLRVQSEATREKMRLIAATRPPISEETRQRQSAASKGRPSPMKGRTHSNETKAKMRAAKLGKPLSFEHRQKLSVSLMGNHNNCFDTRQRSALGRFV